MLASLRFGIEPIIGGASAHVRESGRNQGVIISDMEISLEKSDISTSASVCQGCQIQQKTLQGIVCLLTVVGTLIHVPARSAELDAFSSEPCVGNASHDQRSDGSERRAAVCKADLLAEVPNFRVVNGHVFRGAQPSSYGWKLLAKLGIQIIIDLRPDGEFQEHWTGSEREAVETAGMHYISLPMNPWAVPNDRQMSEALAILESGKPVFVHCRAGKDRTGAVIACYRIRHDHWSNERALLEASSYGMSPLRIGLHAYILGFRLENTD